LLAIAFSPPAKISPVDFSLRPNSFMATCPI
jgi:hypothetical protein